MKTSATHLMLAYRLINQKKSFLEDDHDKSHN